MEKLTINMITEIPYLKRIFKGSNFWGGTETSFELIKEKLASEGNEVLVNSNREDFDVMHIFTYFFYAYYLMMRFKGEKPIVVHSNTTPADIRMSVPFDRLILQLARPYLKRFYNGADLVICVSDYARGSLRGLGVKARMTELPHGVDLGVMKYSKDKEELFRQRFDLREDDPVVLSVGHLIPRKGIRTFFNIAKKLPDAKFFWVGPFLIFLNPEIGSIINSRQNNLTFTGYLDDVVSAYSACDVFVFPSYSENFGIPLIEAAACKKPILVRDIPSYSWLTHEVDCLKARNDDEFVAYTKRLLEDEELRNNLIREGFRKAEEHDIGKVVKRLIEQYRSLMTGREE